MDSNESISRQFKRYRNQLGLENLHRLGSGLFRAMQPMKIGEEFLCYDELLIEEVVYETPEILAMESGNILIKKGGFSAFEHVSTPCPKYCFTDKRSRTAWFCTSVPRVSLSAVLAELDSRFPPCYTWDIGIYFSDVVREIHSSLIEPFEWKWATLKSLPGRLRETAKKLPARLSGRQRMSLAVSIIDEVLEKHRAGITHRNLTADTIFFTNATAPRLLNNYTGVIPPYMETVLPGQVRNTTSGIAACTRYIDAFSVAALAYRIVTGESFESSSFMLDREAFLFRQETAADEQGVGRVWKPLRYVLLPVLAIYRLIRAAVTAIQIVFDPVSFPHYRRLVRATGPWYRSIPGIRVPADILFPTRTARMMRAVLDKRYFERRFGAFDRQQFNSREGKWGKACRFLRAVMAHGGRRITKKIAAVIADMTAQSHQNAPDFFDDENGKTPLHRQWIGKRTILGAGIAAAIIVAASIIGYAARQGWIKEFILSRTEQRAANREMNGQMELDPRWEQAYGEKPQQSSDNPAAPGTHPENDTRHDNKRKAARSVKTAPTAETAADPEKENKSVSRTKPCSAYLTPLDISPKVYEIVEYTPSCSFGDIRFDEPGKKGSTLRGMAGRYTKFFICKKTKWGYGGIKGVRICTDAHTRCTTGEFYEAVGYSNIGKKITAHSGDLVAFNWFDLNTFKKKVGQ
jgi:hypothetical protein